MIKPVKEDKYYKKLFSPESEPYTAKLCLSVVLKCFGEFIENFSFNIKVTIAEMSTEKRSQFFFLTMFEKGKILRKIWICLNNFFFNKPVIEDKYYKNCFSPQSETNTANLCLSVVLKCFGEFIENFSFNIKVTIAEMSTEKPSQFFFLTMFEKGKILRKIWICLNNFFLNKPVIEDKYYQKNFSPQSETNTAKPCLSVVLNHFWGNS